MRIEQLQARSDQQTADRCQRRLDRHGRGGAHARAACDRQRRFRRAAGRVRLRRAARRRQGHGEVRCQLARQRRATFRLGGARRHARARREGRRLLEIEPGAGRVLGLLSIAQLPRRLTLDFRDFFSKGFAFNRIDGHVRFAGGSARSDDLVIDGPAAEIDIRGAADLRAQTFDQTIEVLPKAGNLLTVGRRDRRRPGRRGDRRGRERGAEEAAGPAGRQDLSRDRAVEGSQGRSDHASRAAPQGRPQRDRPTMPPNRLSRGRSVAVTLRLKHSSRQSLQRRSRCHRPDRIPMTLPLATRRNPPAAARRPRHRRPRTRLRHAARPGHRFRRPVFPARAARELDGRGRHRQGRRAFDRAGRRRARDQRREDRLRLFRRNQRRRAARSGEVRARDRARRLGRMRRARWCAAAAARCIAAEDPIDAHRQRGQGRSAARDRQAAARRRSARAAGDGEPGRRRRHRAGRAQRRRARRRRAAAGALQRAGDRRTERPPRERLRRRRRALFVRGAARRRQAAKHSRAKRCARRW